MTAGTLFGQKDDFRAVKALVAARYAGAELKLEAHGVVAMGKSFGFRSGDLTLFDSNAIAYHICSKLRGKSDAEKSEVIQWLGVSGSDFLPAVLQWVLPSVSAVQSSKQQTDSGRERTTALLHLLNEHLLTKTFLVGDRLSLADLCLACDLLPAFQHVLDAHHRDSVPNVTRWFNTVVHQPEFKAVLEVHLCQKAAEFDRKHFDEIQKEKAHHGQHGHQPAKSKEGKKDKKKSESEQHPPKEEKKEKKEEKGKKAEAEAEPEEDMDAAEEALASEPKQKDPFAAMPKGTFVYDDFKKVYSNKDVSESIPYFWQHFDKEANSIWYCEYKFPKELTLVFMSCNLITGMYQRLDKMRKNAFGSMILFGEDNNSTISGVWVWKGQELVFPLSEDWQIDYESYEWRKLNPDSEADRKMVNEYFTWEGSFNGKKFNQGKIFK